VFTPPPLAPQCFGATGLFSAISDFDIVKKCPIFAFFVNTLPHVLTKQCHRFSRPYNRNLYIPVPGLL
jgi:hypothetical protein